MTYLQSKIVNNNYFKYIHRAWTICNSIIWVGDWKASEDNGDSSELSTPNINIATVCDIH